MTKNDEVELPLSSAELQIRVTSYTYISYSNFAYLIKSGVFAVASLTLIKILAPDESWRLVRISFWAASSGFALVSLVTWNRGSMLSNGRANASDSLLPLLMGIVEYGMFIVLLPRKVPGIQWEWWYAFLAAHGFLAMVLVWNRIAQTNVARDFDDDLAQLGRDYVGWIQRDRMGAAAVGIMGSFAFAATETIPYLRTADLEWVHCTAGIVMFLLSLGIVKKSASQHRDVAKCISQIRARTKASPA